MEFNPPQCRGIRLIAALFMPPLTLLMLIVFTQEHCLNSWERLEAFVCYVDESKDSDKIPLSCSRWWFQIVAEINMANHCHKYNGANTSQCNGLCVLWWLASRFGLMGIKQNKNKVSYSGSLLRRAAQCVFAVVLFVRAYYYAVWYLIYKNTTK